MVNAEKIKSAN
jgi:signal transduction histidine kinase